MDTSLIIACVKELSLLQAAPAVDISESEAGQRGLARIMKLHFELGYSLRVSKDCFEYCGLDRCYQSMRKSMNEDILEKRLARNSDRARLEDSFITTRVSCFHTFLLVSSMITNMVILALCYLLLPASFSFETSLSSVRFIEQPGQGASYGTVHRNRTVFTLLVSIGTPPQKIPLIVDTWRNPMTVYDPNCKNCKGDNRFYRNLSKSFTLAAQPGQPTDEIVRGTDVVDLSGNGSFRMANHSIEVVMSTTGPYHYGNGFFGLSPTNELLDQMRCAKYIDKVAFAVFFTGDGSSNVSKSGLDPVISWGSWDVKKYSTREKFEFVDIVSETEWKIRVDSVKFGDLELAGKDSYAILDTKEGRFAIPHSLYENVFHSMMSEIFGTHTSDFPCSKFNIDLPDIIVTIGSVSISIPKEVYIFSSNDFCSYEIHYLPNQEEFRFGVSFFQSAYVLFDLYNRRIGIAPSKNVQINHTESKLWVLIAITAAGLAVVCGTTWAVYRCRRKKRAEAVYDETTDQLISNRNNNQLPG